MTDKGTFTIEVDTSKEKENTAALDYESVVKSFEPNWLTGDLGNYPVDKPVCELLSKEGIYQQSDLLKPMLDDIVKYGLNYTYQKYGGQPLPLSAMAKKQEPVKYSKTSNKKHVIIVGAGVAGLSAAYELTKVGHEVDILEMQNRVGGRVKTLREKDGFSKYCHSEAGAMRLPKPPDAPNKTHFLTDYYAAEEFKLNLIPFNNYDKNAWYKFYDKDKIRISEWKKNSKDCCNEFWNGWDSKIKGNTKVHVEDIDDYYNQTTEIVTNQLISKLKSIQCENPQEKERYMAKVWNDWIKNWSKFSLMGFLQNTKDGVLQLLDEAHQLDQEAAKKLDALIPWPDTAITAYTVYTYTIQLDLSLVVILRDQLGKWWSPHMHCIEDGMHKLPEAFIKERESPWPDHTKINLDEKITYHVKVDEIIYTATNPHDFQNLKVKVKGKYVSSAQPFEIEGDAVIITAPLNIVRQIQFVPAKGTKPAKKLTDMYKALEDIFQSPATKIMLQYKERFWEKEPDNIHGGFSKTSMPIGQLHYPSDSDVKSKRGILMSYTWKSEALMFAALKPADAVREAVKEVARIHPNSEKYFEVGEVQAWSNDPHSQGAYALLKPHQYTNVHFLMTNPCLNMFFAGDGISFAAGWIQGALESGLRAAYQFYCRNEKTSKSFSVVVNLS